MGFMGGEYASANTATAIYACPLLYLYYLVFFCRFSRICFHFLQPMVCLVHYVFLYSCFAG